MKVSVSYLTRKFDEKKTIEMIENSNADYIHVDLMDGGFVPNRNFTIDEVLALLQNHTKDLDIHLMTFDPIIYVNNLATLNPSFITFQLEATKEIVKTIEEIKKHGIRVGLAIKPGTNILELMPYLSLIDLVLIMSVEPGMGGQSFLMSSVSRLEEVLKIRKENNLNFLIEMDGGINDSTIKLVSGLDMVVSGSYICMSDNYDEKINSLK